MYNHRSDEANDRLQEVEPDEACPKCGERSIDNLAWDKFSETVECQSCNTTYIPNEPTE